jgi:hypothetical protein
MKSVIAMVLLAALLAGCGGPPMGPAEPGGPPPPPVAYGPAPGSVFRAGDFAWSTVPGSASIVGAVTYHVGPLRYTCEGEDVILTPHTPWTRRRMMILYGSDSSAAVPVEVVRTRIPSAPSGDYVRFVHKAVCAPDNHFVFNDLPDGVWFVITVARPLGGGGRQIAVMRRVETHGGQRFVSLN